VEQVLHPRDFGLPTHALSEVCGGDATENAQIMKRLLSNHLDGPIRDFVLLNAGALLHVAGKASGWKEGVELAKKAIADGTALHALESFAKLTESIASGFM